MNGYKIPESFTNCFFVRYFFANQIIASKVLRKAQMKGRCCQGLLISYTFFNFFFSFFFNWNGDRNQLIEKLTTQFYRCCERIFWLSCWWYGEIQLSIDLNAHFLDGPDAFVCLEGKKNANEKFQLKPFFSRLFKP